MDKIGETTLEIDLAALEHNYRHLKAKIRPKTKFLAVIKAFAYGNDMVAIAKKMETLGVDYFAVAYSKEGVLLRDAGIMSPILVFHPQPIHFGELIDQCLEPSLYSTKTLKLFLETAQGKSQKGYPVHLKFNTGLNRLGFREDDVDWIVEHLKGKKELKVISVFSHLAASEDLDERQFSTGQIIAFKKINRSLGQKLGHFPFRHLLNTSGILNYPQAQFEMVRSGIGLYGYGNSTVEDSYLKPVATLKTVISQTHKIRPRETVGYNRAFKSEGYRAVATLPLGHADGIGRQYGGGKAYVTINGEKAPIVGNVCMDMLMVDVTGIDCKEGDEVLVFGQNQSAETFAASANTISYEILAAISPRVKRVIVHN